jgi:hypothetical protein
VRNPENAGSQKNSIAKDGFPGLAHNVPRLTLVCALVGTEFGLNKDTDKISISQGEELKLAHSVNLVAGFSLSRITN